MSTGKTTPKTSPKDELRTRMRGKASKFVSGVIKPLLTELNVELEKAGRKTLVTEVTENFVKLIEYNDACVKAQRAAKTEATRYAKANSPAKPKGIFHPHATFAQRTKMELRAKLVTEKAKQLRKLKENKDLDTKELGELAYHAITEEDKKSISETADTMYKAWVKTPEGIEAHKKYNDAKAASPTAGSGSSSPTEEERRVLYTLIALAFRPTVIKHYRAGNGGGARVGNPTKPKDGHEVWEDCISGPPATIKKVLKSIRAAFASDPKLTAIVAHALTRIGRSSDPKTGAKTSGYDGVTEKMLKKAVKVLSKMIKGKAPATETVEEEVSEEEPESEEEAESDEEEAESDDEDEASDTESETSDKKSDAGDDTDWGDSDEEGKTEEGAPAPASPPTPTPKSPEVTPPAAAAAKPKPKVVKRESPKVTVSETPVEAEPAKPIKPKGKKGKKASGKTPTEVDE